MQLTTTILMAALFASSTLAEICTLSKAVPLEKLIAAANAPKSGSTTSSNTGSSTNAVDNFNDSEAFRDALSKGSGDNMLSTIGTINSGHSRKRQTSTTATLNCVTGESCLSISARSLICVQLTTMNFHDEDGATGNLITGDYTLKDGSKGNLFKTASSTVSATASLKTVVETGTAAVVKATPTGGVGGLDMGGTSVWGLMVGVLLL